MARNSLGLGPMMVGGEVLAGKYEITHVIGEGGMCIVYSARHIQLQERVALKLLRAEVAQDPEVVERFMREGRAAIRISSDHVVRILDVDVLENGEPYLVMEYLEGSDLDALILAHGPSPVPVAIDYVLQAGEAIAEAHTLGIIHRDLKPANLFLTRRADGSPWLKVLDFGISKVAPRKSSPTDVRLTGVDSIMGSPNYMSPEQLRSTRNVDQRSDIWSIGAILHELLCGEPPFDADTMPVICAKIMKEAPPPLTRKDLPEGLEAIVHRCLEKDAADRFADMAELAAALAPFGTQAGQASAQRIAAILQSAVKPFAGGILVKPTQTTAWGGTDPSFGVTSGNVTTKRSKAGTFGLVAGALILVAGGAAGAVMYMHPPSDAHAPAAVSTVTGAAPELNIDGHEIPPPPADSAAGKTASPSTSAASASNASTKALQVRRTPFVRASRPPPAPNAPPPAPSVTPEKSSANPDGLFDERK